MKSILSLVLMVSMFFPVVTHAAVLKTINVSSVQTGGIKVEGKSIVTGSSSASAEIKTVIRDNPNPNQAVVTVEVETGVDGVKRKSVFEWWGGFWGKVQSVFWFF